MRFRTTLILLILVLAAGAYVWFVDRFKPSTDEKQRVAKRVFKDFNPEKLTAIRIVVNEHTNKLGAIVRTDTFELERSLAGWTLLKPVNFPADEIKIRQILDLVKKIDQSRTTTPEEYKKINRGDMGLDSPAVVATFVMPATALTVRVGFEVPAQWANYVEIEGVPEVYYVPSHFKDALEFKTDSSDQDIRRHRIFDLRPYQVSSLLMEGAAASVEVRRNEAGFWRVTQPVMDAADGARIEDMLKQIETVSVASFDATATTFGQPWLTITAVEGTRSQRLQLGNEASGPDDFPDGKGVRPKGCWIARRLEYEQAFLIKKRDVEPYAAPADTFRLKQLVDVAGLGDVTHLSQDADGKTIEFDCKGTAWSMPGADAPLISPVNIENYVYDWIEMAVTNVADPTAAKAALASPWIKLAVSFKSLDAPRVVTLSKPANGIVYAERAPGVIVALDEQAVRAHLATNELRMIDEKLIATQPDDVREVDMRAGGLAYKLAQSSNQWVCILSNSIAATDVDVTGVLKEVLPLRAAACIARAADKDLAVCGLAAPGRIIGVTDQAGVTTTVLVGLPHEGTNYFCMIQGQPYMFLVPRDSLETLCTLDLAVQPR